jgi:2-keto-3-deoxy-L-rhamnonate aldolase RhmA
MQGANVMFSDFRQRLLGGERLVGTMVTLDSPEVVEILVLVGFDWLFFDAEHAPLGDGSMQRMIQAAGKTPCVIRLPDHGESSVKRALDMGAAGIIVPQVNTAEQAEKIVGYSRYAPEGMRGVGVGRAQGYGLNFNEYVAQANENIAVIVQAEHIAAVEDIHDIASVEGLDAVFVGPYDLSASLGKLGQVEDAAVIEAIDRVERVCTTLGKRLGIFAMSVEAVAPFARKGYTLLTVGIDTNMLGSAAKKLLEGINKI